MWPLCTANSFLWLLIPFLIGLLTGFWAWARSRTAPAGSTAHDPAVREVSDTEPFPAARQASRARPESINHALSPKPDPALSSESAIGIPAAVGEPDDLTRVKGIGPKLNELLQSLGVTRFDQIACWGPYEIAKVDSHLGAFRGRITRDCWIEQAKLLASGATDKFEARFGRTAANAD